MDELLSFTSEEFDKEHYEELLKLVEKRYSITSEQIIDSRNQEEISDDMYHALDMLMIDPMKWCNLKLLRKDPELDNNFVNELRKYTCQFEKKCNEIQDAIINGHLGCLKCFHENGWLLNKYMCDDAVENGHLECVKYFHENGCLWDEWTCAYAAGRCKIDCLKYLHENGCPWNKWTCYNAVEKGRIECLKYAVENGCPIDRDECISVAKEYGKLDCVLYLESL